MKSAVLFSILLIVTSAWSQDVSPLDRARITILNGNTGEGRATKYTEIDAGPVVGNMLNAHYFPAIQNYGYGRYDYAETDMTFVINRPYALNENQRQGEFMSTAYYIRGMIYFHHASGIGRHRLARTDFENAIKWNSRNFVAYLELSRVYAELSLKDESISILRRLLELELDKTTAGLARAELKKLGVESKQ